MVERNNLQNTFDKALYERLAILEMGLKAHEDQCLVRYTAIQDKIDKTWELVTSLSTMVQKRLDLLLYAVIVIAMAAVFAPSDLVGLFRIIRGP